MSAKKKTAASKKTRSARSRGTASTQADGRGAGEAPKTAGTAGASGASGNTADDVVVIRKYENRRLYDTQASKYINLERVAEMVREGIDVRVVEVKTDRDVTRQVLTQIIVESSREKGGPPLEFLRDLVRANDKAHRDFFQWYLASAAEVYQTVRENWERAYRLSPAGRLANLSKLWPDPIGQALGRVLNRESARRERPGAAPGPEAEPRPSGDGADPADDDAGAAAELEELQELRRRLERLERRVQSG
ncbi:MAG: hypothetical protein DWQ36_02355 [Acidobacteria bacterium]|nr:MAG: hypothetical protein DWQ30_23745 [Acidobacteriota bacterium]REK11285.1 MAG: hypothetical protein DWQ36_02355 [Acidobacteriota bacterium]